MKYYTLKDIESLIDPRRKIVKAWQENKYIVAEVDNGVRIKFLNW